MLTPLNQKSAAMFRKVNGGIVNKAVKALQKHGELPLADLARRIGVHPCRIGIELSGAVSSGLLIRSGTKITGFRVKLGNAHANQEGKA